MMTWVGVILALAGGIPAAMMYFGVAPDLLEKVPLGMTPLIGIAVIGVGIVLWNRRPGN